MEVIVYGIRKGVSKAKGNDYYQVHCVDLSRTRIGLLGNEVSSYFCTSAVYQALEDYIKGDPARLPFNCNIGSDFGSRTVSKVDL